MAKTAQSMSFLLRGTVRKAAVLPTSATRSFPPSLLGLLDPVQPPSTTSTSSSSAQPVRAYRGRSVRPTYLQLNKRLDAIKLDERLRWGHEKIRRRSEFLEW